MERKEVNDFLTKMVNIGKNTDIIEESSSCKSFIFDDVKITTYGFNRITIHGSNFYNSFDIEDILIICTIGCGFTIQLQPIYNTIIVSMVEKGGNV